MKSILIAIFLMPFTAFSQQLSTVYASGSTVLDYSAAFSFGVGNYFGIKNNFYIGPGLSVYKLQNIKGAYIPITCDFVYAGKTKVAFVAMIRPGYGFYGGSEKTTWSPFMSTGAGIQFNGHKTGAYLLLDYSRISLAYVTRTDYGYDGPYFHRKVNYDLIGVKAGIFLKHRKKKG